MPPNHRTDESAWPARRLDATPRFGCCDGPVDPRETRDRRSSACNLLLTGAARLKVPHSGRPAQVTPSQRHRSRPSCPRPVCSCAGAFALPALGRTAVRGFIAITTDRDRSGRRPMARPDKQPPSQSSWTSFQRVRGRSADRVPRSHREAAAGPAALPRRERQLRRGQEHADQARRNRGRRRRVRRAPGRSDRDRLPQRATSVEAAKGLRDFAKANPALVIKGGVLDGKADRREGDRQARRPRVARGPSRQARGRACSARSANAVSLLNAPLAQAARLVGALQAKAEQDPSILAGGAGTPAARRRRPPPRPPRRPAEETAEESTEAPRRRGPRRGDRRGATESTEEAADPRGRVDTGAAATEA